MSIPYRTRRTLNRLAVVLLILVLVAVAAWLCWVVWLQRYVVYTSDGATLDFDISANDVAGEVATPQVPSATVNIFYNEGSDAISTSNDLELINGYYITVDMFQQDMDNVLLQIERLSSGTAVMIDMKGPYGSFYYNSTLSDAVISQSTDIEAVANLVDRLKSKGFYTIARVSAFRDYNFGLNHVSSGLYLTSRIGLWADSDGMYWLDPTNTTTTSWIASVILELKGLGFNEVVLSNFCFPDSTGYLFDGDKDAALQSAAATLVSATASSDFVLSFCVDNAAFPLPDERCRLYLENVGADSAASRLAQVDAENPEVHLVFLTETTDSRYDDYSVLRSIETAEEMIARAGG